MPFDAPPQPPFSPFFCSTRYWQKALLAWVLQAAPLPLPGLVGWQSNVYNGNPNWQGPYAGLINTLSDDGAVYSEVSDSTYARIPPWRLFWGVSGIAYQVQSNGIGWNNFADDWGTVNAIGLFDQPAHGNLLYYSLPLNSGAGYAMYPFSQLSFPCVLLAIWLTGAYTGSGYSVYSPTPPAYAWDWQLQSLIFNIPWTYLINTGIRPFPVVNTSWPLAGPSGLVCVWPDSSYYTYYQSNGTFAQPLPITFSDGPPIIPTGDTNINSNDVAPDGYETAGGRFVGSPFDALILEGAPPAGNYNNTVPPNWVLLPRGNVTQLINAADTYGLTYVNRRPVLRASELMAVGD
jgi:hypothetical protein